MTHEEEIEKTKEVLALLPDDPGSRLAILATAFGIVSEEQGFGVEETARAWQEGEIDARAGRSNATLN